MIWLDDQLVEHPDSGAWHRQLADLRETLTQLLARHDHLLHTVRPNLLALYQVRIGLWELQLLQKECQVARLRRQIELVQAAANHGRPPDPQAIQQTLDHEFELWQVRLREAVDKLEASKDLLQHPMSTADDQEFKQLYRNLVKQLHPDVAPGQPETVRLLWQQVQAAYRRSDSPGPAFRPGRPRRSSAGGRNTRSPPQ